MDVLNQSIMPRRSSDTLWQLVYLNQTDDAHKLLDQDDDPKRFFEHQRSPYGSVLHVAMVNRNVSILRRLLSMGMDPMTPNRYWMERNGKEEMVLTELVMGYYPEIFRPHEFDTFREMTRILIEAGANPLERTMNGTPMWFNITDNQILQEFTVHVPLSTMLTIKTPSNIDYFAWRISNYPRMTLQDVQFFVDNGAVPTNDHIRRAAYWYADFDIIRYLVNHPLMHILEPGLQDNHHHTALEEHLFIMSDLNTLTPERVAYNREYLPILTQADANARALTILPIMSNQRVLVDITRFLTG